MNNVLPSIHTYSYRVLVLQCTCPCFAVHVSSQHALSKHSCCCLVQLIMKRKERGVVYCLEVSGEVVSSAVIGTVCTGLPRFWGSCTLISRVLQLSEELGQLDAQLWGRVRPFTAMFCVARQWKMQIKFSFVFSAPTVVQRYIAGRFAGNTKSALWRLFLWNIKGPRFEVLYSGIAENTGLLWCDAVCGSPVYGVTKCTACRFQQYKLLFYLNLETEGSMFFRNVANISPSQTWSLHRTCESSSVICLSYNIHWKIFHIVKSLLYVGRGLY